MVCFRHSHNTLPANILNLLQVKNAGAGMSLNKIQLCGVATISNESLVMLLNRRFVKFLGCLFTVSAELFSSEVFAAWDGYSLNYSAVASGYRNCSYRDLNEVLAIYSVTIDFNSSDLNLDDNEFESRGVVLYAYDGSGLLTVSNTYVTGFSLNGTSGNTRQAGVDFSLYQGTLGDWAKAVRFSADVTIIMPKSNIAAWPGIGVRAANTTSVNPVADSAGVVYIGPNSNGTCTLYANPENPPLPVTPKVTMTAPDWDLGVLPRGEETVLTLPATKDQLCFNYEGTTGIANQKYLINATNTNGLSANGRYLLKSLEDSSQTVPYSLTLANSTDSVLLPNTQGRVFSMDAGGRTCFTPTFTAQPDKAAKSGAYSDILTFTVVAKP